MPEPSEMDRDFLMRGRAHISGFRDRAIMKSEARAQRKTTQILEIGPEKSRHGYYAYGGKFVLKTLDIKPGCDYEGDITQRGGIPAQDEKFDVVICLDVLEHTLDPFAAMREIWRVTADEGLLYASAPMNFREHGPLPDCWRFTRHGWHVLLKDWIEVHLDVLMTPDRPLMPLHINARARKTKRPLNGIPHEFRPYDT